MICACARTREFCVTQGCAKNGTGAHQGAAPFEWRYSTEGREKDRLRRVVDLRQRRKHENGRPVTRWIKPERAIAEAFRLNMEAPVGTVFIEKLGVFEIDTPGVP